MIETKLIINNTFDSGPTTRQTVGEEMKLGKNVLAVDLKKRLGHVQI